MFRIACRDNGKSYLGCDFFAFEHLHRLTRHDRRDRMLIDKLGMAVSTQQDAEIVEGRNNARELYAIDQKDCE
ncbi:hypothetical protein GGE67_005112 [Rhizobium leucaenae]|uniref:Uncharacterized protein n=1 Tax=Rhizobium leucaenae TaxID=29450 RepID=A0A7W7EMU3_9HYPH|nr:hypothetical protein [Rhizobium leucaenae]MBB6304466.1 hypothetical protein [Rhizobium leucaenae]